MMNSRALLRNWVCIQFVRRLCAQISVNRSIRYIIINFTYCIYLQGSAGIVVQELLCYWAIHVRGGVGFVR